MRGRIRVTAAVVAVMSMGAVVLSSCADSRESKEGSDETQRTVSSSSTKSSRSSSDGNRDVEEGPKNELEVPRPGAADEATGLADPEPQTLRDMDTSATLGYTAGAKSVYTPDGRYLGKVGFVAPSCESYGYDAILDRSGGACTYGLVDVLENSANPLVWRYTESHSRQKTVVNGVATYSSWTRAGDALWTFARCNSPYNQCGNDTGKSLCANDAGYYTCYTHGGIGKRTQWSTASGPYCPGGGGHTLGTVDCSVKFTAGRNEQRWTYTAAFFYDSRTGTWQSASLAWILP
jgi:hypothetical protein